MLTKAAAKRQSGMLRDPAGLPLRSINLRIRSNSPCARETAVARFVCLVRLKFTQDFVLEFLARGAWNEPPKVTKATNFHA